MFTASWILVSVIGVIVLLSGQEPQTGLLLPIKGELLLKDPGSELIFVTHQPDISWLKEELKNIPDILVTLLTSQELISWLNGDSLNILLISVILSTFQELISWLKSVPWNNPVALTTLLTSQELISWLNLPSTTISPFPSTLLNIANILVTLPTFQELISWLNGVPLNILPIFVTLLTSQELMSPLKLVLFKNASLISVTLLTSHSVIEPYSLSVHKPVTGCVYKQVFTASWILESVIGVLLLIIVIVFGFNEFEGSVL